jgi:Phage integrase, N-terminal SAM-like domain
MLSCFPAILPPMNAEIALSSPLGPFPDAPALPQACSDAHLIEIWLHGRSLHTQRAYRADIDRFRAGAGKPLPAVTLSDLQDFADSLDALAPASRYRTLSAIKSLLAFAQSSLPDPMKHFVEEQVNMGGYSSASEYVRAASGRENGDRAPRLSGRGLLI